ncbi:MAG: glycosyltransferase family 39 protein [Anaerolineae bacterium]|nr:glycosyltransferase family 39 protein [Anaerolineae bacterium]
MRIRWLLIFLLLFYWAISLHNLAYVPQVDGDEPWLASAAWKLATTGILGSDMFAGFHRMDQRAYGYMPIQPMAMALMLRLVGLGLFPARLVSVIMGLFTLALTYALGKRLFGARVGLTAVTLLLLWRTTTLTPMLVSGVLFVDVARIARYDIFVPVFGLAALHGYISAHRQGEWWRYMLAGGLAAMSTLANVYGAFWLGVLLILLLWNREGWRAILFLLAGAAIVWSPYALYIWQDIPSWRGQLLVYPSRYELLSWRWYLTNMVREPYRYVPGLGGHLWKLFARPGLLLLLLAVPLSLAVLAARAIWRRDWAARVLMVPALLLPLLFALLIFSKYINYLVTIVPVWAVAVAWVGVMAWQQRPYRWTRPLLVAITLLILWEGMGRHRALWQSGQTLQPYRPFISQVRQYIPADARILGLQTYWLGLDDFTYRSWFVPMARSRDVTANPPPTIPEALTAVDPTVILIDDAVQGMLLAEPAIRDWMTAQGFELQGVVEDTTYGRMEIWVQR